MKRTVPRLDGPARRLAREELIGRTAAVSASTDPGLVGRTGTIVDESLRTFTLQGPDGRRAVVGKFGTTFRFGDVEIPGAAIEFRPEDRTKKVK